jgi:hypothetical protein
MFHVKALNDLQFIILRIKRLPGVHFKSLWSLPARSEDHSGGRKTLYFLCGFFTAKGAKKLCPPERIIRAGKER